MRTILAGHARRYPRWTEEDLYKLVHQAALGSEHAVQDEALARERLAREIAVLGPGPEEPLLDPLSPEVVDPRLVGSAKGGVVLG